MSSIKVKLKDTEYFIKYSRNNFSCIATLYEDGDCKKPLFSWIYNLDIIDTSMTLKEFKMKMLLDGKLV